MLTVQTFSETPPGGWKVHVHETNHTVSHYAWDAFIKAYEGHLLANNIPLLPNYQETLVDRMCRENPNWDCKQAGKFKAVGKGNLFGPIMSFLRFALNWAKESAIDGKPAWVSQEVAQERANICASCPYNSRKILFSCGNCGGAFVKLAAMVMGKELALKEDRPIGSCKICSCVLKVAVHMPLKVQQDALDESTKDLFREPELTFCWKSRGL